MPVNNFYTFSQTLYDHPEKYQIFADHVRHQEDEMHSRFDKLLGLYKNGTLSERLAKGQCLLLLRGFDMLSGVKSTTRRWEKMSVENVVDECHESINHTNRDTIWFARMASSGCKIPNGNPSDCWIDNIFATLVLSGKARKTGFADVDYSMCW
jgi:hypothetical protein